MTRLSTQAGQLVKLSIVAAMALVLGGCPFQGGRNLDRGRNFSSPLQAFAAASELDVNSIRQVLSDRVAPVKTARVSFDLTAGGGLRGKQIFSVGMLVESPNFLRLRGSQNEGTMFDVLVNRQNVKILIFPERRYYSGTLKDLQANPGLLAGLNPEDLMDNYTVEQTLLARLSQNPMPEFQTTRDHYILGFAFSNGMSERYYLRKQDLLTDVYERSYNGQYFSRIRYWGYQAYAGNQLLPSQFTIELPGKGGQLAARVTQAEINAIAPPQVKTMEVPDGFERMAIGTF